MQDPSPFETTFHEYVDLAKQIADDFKDDSLRHQVVALCLKNNRVAAYGVNQRRYARGMSVFMNSLHAEADLLRKAGDKVRNSRVFLYRFNTADGSPFSGEPKCAKPCLLCGHILRAAKAGTIVFMNQSGKVEDLEVESLPMLRSEPSLLTRMFLERTTKEHGKFVASNYLKEGA